MKRFWFGANVLMAVTVPVLLTACGGTTVQENPDPTPGLNEPAAPGGQESRPAPKETGKVQVDRQTFLLQEYLKLAQAEYDLGEFDRAYENLKKALQVAPDNRKARDFMAKVAARLGDRPATAADVQEQFDDTVKVRIEQTRMKVMEMLQKAELAMASKEYAKAIGHCENALLAIRYNPYIQKGDTLVTKVQARKGAIEKAIKELQKLDQEMLAKEAAAELARKERQNTRRKLYKVARLFKQANLAFAAGRYKACTENLEVVLQLDPDNPGARRLIELSRDASHDADQQRYLDRWKTEWAKTFADLNESDVPMIDPIKYDARRWAEVVKRKPIGGFKSEEAGDDVENAAILAKLAATKVKPNFTEAELEEWVNYFKQVTEINFVVSTAVRELDTEETAIKGANFPKMSAVEALNVITKLTKVRWKVENGVVHVVTPEQNLGKVYTLFYDVRDLVAQLNHFPGKEIYLVPGDMETEVPEPPEPTAIVLDGDRLVDLIQNNMGVQGAFEMEGASIQLQGRGVIIARTTREVHSRLEKLLADLRINTGILVNVEARFLKVEDKFLEEIGVDFRGLGDDSSQGEPGKGLSKKRSRVSTRFDDFGTGTTATTPGELGTGTEPGIFFDDGNDGDLTARTENLFDQALGNPVEGMTNAGGLALQYTYLDDTEIEAILRAVAKRERVQQINAPNLLVFNAQRAHLTITSQVSYVKDFDVEIAQAAAVANPVVGTVSDGIVLDVMPVVSADRRYITMELRPTLAQLERPIPTYSTTLGVGQEITIQLPKLQIQRVRTTIKIPDGGTLMLGGMKVTTKQDYKSGIPILKDLPLLSFFFSRQGTYSSNRKVFILLKASIVIPPEMEPRTLVQ